MAEERRNSRSNNDRRGGDRRFGGRRGPREDGLPEGLERKVIDIRRVAKVRAGAKRLRFSAVVAVGDRKGRVNVGLGRGGDTKSAINKAVKYAADRLVNIALIGDTIPHEVTAKYSAAKLLIKPAGPGTGVTASGPVRSVMEVAGIRNVLTKQLGSSNAISNAYCTVEALKMLDSRRIKDRRLEMARSRRINSKKSEEKGGTAPDSKKEK